MKHQQSAWRVKGGGGHFFGGMSKVFLGKVLFSLHHEDDLYFNTIGWKVSEQGAVWGGKYEEEGLSVYRDL